MGLPKIGLLGTRASRFGEILVGSRVGNTGTLSPLSSKRRLVSVKITQKTRIPIVDILVSDGMLTEGWVFAVMWYQTGYFGKKLTMSWVLLLIIFQKQTIFRFWVIKMFISVQIVEFLWPDFWMKLTMISSARWRLDCFAKEMLPSLVQAASTWGPFCGV